MVIRVTLSSLELVDRNLEDIYTKAMVIQTGLDLFFDETNIMLRKHFIDECGDGNEAYILVPSTATSSSILIDIIKPRLQKPKKKLFVTNPADLVILYEYNREVAHA